MSLTDVAVRNVKPSKKTLRFFDERGPYLEVLRRAADGGG
jgi:hypothetical protein